MSVRTRIAPSPTGNDIHVGNLYTALINYAFAKQSEGQFVIRIEDTDRERLVEGSTEKILETLKRFGIEADESPVKSGPYGPYVQSQRLDIYKKYALELVEKGHAYYCTCTKERLDEMRAEQIKNKKIPKYDKHCLSNQDSVKKEIDSGKPFVIRLNVKPDEVVKITDELRGDIEFSTNDIDDQVLLKSDGFPTYHLAVVVDDYLMKISHIIRAEEWISSTPKHVILYNSLGFPLPKFIHLPLLRNPDRSKLSKRKNPVWAGWYLDEGYLPEAVLNYLALMGWSHPQAKEIFSLDEFIKVFDIKRIDTAGPVFDLVKLDWMNGLYIRNLSLEELYSRLINFDSGFKMYEKDKFLIVLSLIHDRIKKLSEVKELITYFYDSPTNYAEIKTLATKESKKSYDLTKEVISKVVETLSSLSEWKKENIDSSLHDLMTNLQIKPREFFMPIRISVSGVLATPPLADVLEVLGKEEVLKRLNAF